MPLTIRDPYGNRFEVDESARPFWEHREGHEILPSSEDEPAAPAESAPAKPGDPKPTSKAAVRPAQDVKEQPGG